MSGEWLRRGRNKIMCHIFFMILCIKEGIDITFTDKQSKALDNNAWDSCHTDQWWQLLTWPCWKPLYIKPSWGMNLSSIFGCIITNAGKKMQHRKGTRLVFGTYQRLFSNRNKHSLENLCELWHRKHYTSTHLWFHKTKLHMALYGMQNSTACVTEWQRFNLSASKAVWKVCEIQNSTFAL